MSKFEAIDCNYVANQKRRPQAHLKEYSFRDKKPRNPVDGLKGFPEAINAVFPQTIVQTCIVPEGVRRIIYTTNAIEALNSKLRRAVRTRGHFPSDDAATKLLYLVLNRATAEWKRPLREWAEAKTQFAVMFSERFVNS